MSLQDDARAMLIDHTPLGDRATRKRLIHARRRAFETVGSSRFSRPSAAAIGAQLERFLPATGGVFVEAGANDGYTWSNTYYLERWKGWRGVLVEGIPELAAECRALRTESQVFNCALVAPGYSSATVTMTYADLGSLISHSEPELEALLGGFEKRPYEIEVPARTLGDVLDEAGVGRPDFICLDLEGHEPNAIRGMDLERQGADWMLVEVLGHEGRAGVEQALGDLYEPVAEVTGADILYRRRAIDAARSGGSDTIGAVTSRAASASPAPAPTRAGDPSILDPALRGRIERTTSVRATDRIAKVADAGAIRVVDGREVQVMHNGVVVEKDCYGGPWMTEVISRLRGHHEPQEEVAFADVVDRLRDGAPDPVMIELGSYWAYYSLWFKHEVPSATIVLVEPDPVNLQVGVRNFELNRLTPSSVVPAAVGAQHDSTVDIVCESDGVLRPIRAVTLDGLMADERLPRVDVVLCDVQGAELQMLEGAAGPVRAGKVRFMVISTHWSDSDPLIHQKCRAQIEALDGHIICEHSLPESCSGDGLIVVSFDPRDRDMHIDVPVVRARDSELGELEWIVARRSGWRGIAWGVIDLVPASTRQRLGNSGLGAALHRRLAGRATLR